MTILGLDPGTTTYGYGIIQKTKLNTIEVIDYGAITTTPKIANSKKLIEIYTDLKKIIKKHKPDLIVIEKLFFNKNIKTVMAVSESRGITLLLCEQFKVPFVEYTPLQVKNNLVGYGRAEKRQVQIMVQKILKLKEIPKPDDAADALALALVASYSTIV